jgi:hypothetical protein
MRSNQRKDGMAHATKDPRVIEALGALVEPGWFVSHDLDHGRSGKCEIDIPLKGSKQKGSVHVVGTRKAGDGATTAWSGRPIAGSHRFAPRTPE